MNARSYKTVFSKRLGALVAVGEHATSQGKANGASGPGASGASEGAVSALAGIGYVAALSASFAFVSIAWAAPAITALPTGGTVVQGTASMSQNASQLNITQGSQRAAINWQSFNIGAAATVKVAQPNAQAVLLNRVVGQSPSQIFGKLQANGHVILVNPNGVLFGKDGSVNAGGFTASTLNISDANFMAGNMVYERNGSTAGIVNQGSITAAPGGYVALLGATVSNEGSITTKGGSVVMGAGETIKVPVSGTGRIKLELTPAAINASLSNTGNIVTEGGQVYMQALALNRAAAQILQSGSVDTTGEKGGEVHVLADGGHIRVDGSIKANSTGTDDKGQKLAGGDIYIGRDKDTNVLAAVGDVSGARLESKGGFVETSGDHLVTTGTRVIAKDWLLDPTDIAIVSGATTSPVWNGAPQSTSTILASDISFNLSAGTNVLIQTSSTNTGSQLGNIAVNESISKTGGGEATLTLKAHNNITVAANKSISSTSGKLNVVFNSDVDNSGEGGILMNGGSSILSNGGNITFGGGTSGDGTGYAQSKGGIGIHFSGTNIDAGVGKFSARGKSTVGATGFSAQGVLFSGTNIITAAQYEIDGKSTGAAAVYMGSGNTTFNSTGNGLASSIKGSSGGRGVFIQGGTLNFNANNGSSTTLSSGQGEMRLGFGGGVTVNTNGNVTLGSNQSGFFSQAQTNVESGTLTIKGKSAGHGVAIQDGSGVATKISVKNGSHLVIDGESTGSGSGIHLLPVGVANKIEMSGVNSAGERGTIKMTGVSAAGVGISTSVTPITSDGGDIILSGTSNGLNASGLVLQGLIRSGDGTNAGIVTLNGKANGSGSGVGIFNSGTIQGGTVNMTGEAKGTNNAIFAAGTITSTAGAVIIKGTNTSTASNGGGGTTLHGTVTGQGTVNLEGYSAGGTNQGLVILNAVESKAGDIIVTGETKSATQRAVAINALGGGVFGSLKVADSTKNITINANTLLLAGATTVVDAGASGTVNIKAGNGNEIVIGGNATNDVMTTDLTTQKLGIDQTELNRIKAGSLVIGDTASKGKITVEGDTSTAAATGNLTLQTGGEIAIKKSLTVGSITDRKNLDLKAGGSQITQALNATITANQLTIQAAQANVALDAAANQVNQLAANVRSLDFKNGKALQVGVGNSGITASGRIKVETTMGDLTITKSVATTNADADAVVLNAGADKTFNNETGLFEGLADGNIVPDGGAVIVGEGGVARLYTGSTSTNTASLAGGDGTGRYRYNSDEFTTNFSKALEAGVNVIYREAPLVTVKVNDVNKVYDGIAHSGGSFSSASTAVGLKNGDTDALVGINAVFSGKAQGVKDVLASVGKTISASDNGKNALGYKVTYTDGKLNITPRPLTVAPGSVATKTADGTTAAAVTPGALSNLVGNETLGVAATGTFSDANAGNNKAVNAFYTLQNGANGGLASNYILALGKPGNPDTRMTGTILAAVNPVTPIAPVNNNTGSVSRVRTVSGFGGAGAATGVLDDKAVTESREVCSDVFPENCECQASVIPSIEICFAPKSVAATKEEK